MISIQFNDLFIENIFFAAPIDGVSKIMNNIRKSVGILCYTYSVYDMIRYDQWTNSMFYFIDT